MTVDAPEGPDRPEQGVAWAATTRRDEPDPDYRRSNIGRLLLHAFVLFEDRIRRGLHEQGFEDFGPADARVIRNLDLDGTRISVLAERARITKQAISQTVQDLEARDLVRRVPDPSDGRAKLVKLTPRGRRLVASGQAVNRRLIEEWEDAIGPSGVGELRRLLERLLEERASGAASGEAGASIDHSSNA